MIIPMDSHQAATKWYIELSCGTFSEFNTLDFAFLTHFQLQIRYKKNTELLTSLHQSISIHIFDHIHEWRCHQHFIKAMILDHFLTYWFVKFLLPPIARDVMIWGVTIEEEAIFHTQYLDFVHSQSGELYGIIRGTPHPSLDPSRPT